MLHMIVSVADRIQNCYHPNCSVVKHCVCIKQSTLQQITIGEKEKEFYFQVMLQIILHVHDTISSCNSIWRLHVFVYFLSFIEIILSFCNTGYYYSKI